MGGPLQPVFMLSVLYHIHYWLIMMMMVIWTSYIKVYKANFFYLNKVHVQARAHRVVPVIILRSRCLPVLVSLRGVQSDDRAILGKCNANVINLLSFDELHDMFNSLTFNNVISQFLFLCVYFSTQHTLYPTSHYPTVTVAITSNMQTPATNS